jgi:hypothetical protein
MTIDVNVGSEVVFVDGVMFVSEKRVERVEMKLFELVGRLSVEGRLSEEMKEVMKEVMVLVSEGILEKKVDRCRDEECDGRCEEGKGV